MCARGDNMKIRAIDRNEPGCWVRSDDLESGEMYITKSGRVCIVIYDSCHLIQFLDELDVCYEMPYENVNERFAKMSNVELTIEYDIDRD